ncbi:MAG: alpha-L-fucosidase, partial [Lentisphaeria bacterium]|nr:alpha-L-fucosidase [Lentisphaeria bacterium]
MEQNGHKWFPEARFGMFIHWGLYSVAGGCWKGVHVPWVSEWLMRKCKVPICEYETLAGEFNPVDFNADEWARTAAEAGMKYMVVTAKHHDGFCMYKTAYDSYNIVDATPFGRDPMKELAASCKKYGVKLGFYYSQDQDWHEKGATGNTWDFAAEDQNPEAFQAYLERKVKPQIRELLTNYGEI